MPINPTSIRRPSSPVARTYTPANGHKYKVRDGDSWASLAASRGISPWDLVRYNYPGLAVDVQFAASEVNWYLQQYVGCRRLTPNQRNYAFSSNAAPGEIWLPNAATVALPTPDQVARNLVLSILRGPVVVRMNFGIGRVFIPASNYEMVARAIEGGFITVKLDPSLSNKAVYHTDLNQIDLSPTPDPPLIVHECTHAIFDLRMISTRVEETEGLAYVAQALYGLLDRGPSGRYIVSRDPLHPVNWVAWQRIFDESSRLAGLLMTTHRVTDEDAAELYWAIKNTSWYRPRADRPEINDGVAEAFYNSL